MRRYFQTYRNDPFVTSKGTSADVSGAASMSAQRDQQVSYNPAPGNYAIYDAWLDEDGKSNAGKGVVKVVKLK